MLQPENKTRTVAAFKLLIMFKNCFRAESSKTLSLNAVEHKSCRVAEFCAAKPKPSRIKPCSPNTALAASSLFSQPVKIKKEILNAAKYLLFNTASFTAQRYAVNWGLFRKYCTLIATATDDNRTTNTTLKPSGIGTGGGVLA